MAQTQIQPSSAMDVKPFQATQQPNWTQMSGSASLIVAAPGGSLWALSTLPAGPDKYIWHYVNGTWTNISGLASGLAVAPDGTLYAINSGGGTYSYDGSSWAALGGGSSDVAAARDGSIYVLSNGAAAGADQAIWHYTTGWTQVPGSGVHIAASRDPGSYVVSGGTVAGGGLYILNSAGNIYYENTDNSFVLLPGAASAISATGTGGFYVLGFPVNTNGNGIYYYDLNTPGYTTQNGSGVGVSGYGSTLYVLGSTGAIFTTPIVAASTPSYCSNYSTPGGGVPLNITDDSALGAVLLVYVQNGTSWMDNSGAFTSAGPNPLPAACFSTTTGSPSTRPLNIPMGIGGRIYFAYATPNPNPNILPSNPLAGAPISGPNVGWNSNPFPWDFIEYGTTPGATIDTTQVDALGLPLELSITGGALPSLAHANALPTPCPTSTATIVGVTSCNFAKIFNAMAQIPQYNQLIVTQRFNGTILDMQIVAPKDAVAFTAFPWNLFALNAYMPSPTPTSCPASPTDGYLSCLINTYNTSLANARRFGTNGIGASGVTGDNYCATSDGSSNFIFTDVGSASACPATANPSLHAPGGVNPFKMPIQEFTYGVPPPADGGGGCKQNILFQQPWGNAAVGTGHIFATADAFALWKDMVADLNRGRMLTTSAIHPIGLTNPSMGIFFQDPMFNQYAWVIHNYFNANLAYALAYDDLGHFESGVIWQPGDSFNVRINAVPTASTVFPLSAPVPTPSPNPCPNLPTGVGSF